MKSKDYILLTGFGILIFLGIKYLTKNPQKNTQSKIVVENIINTNKVTTNKPIVKNIQPQVINKTGLETGGNWRSR